MSKPALPAGVANLLAINSLHCELCHSNTFWRVMHQTDPLMGDGFISVENRGLGPDRTLVPAPATLEAWVAQIAKFMERRT